MLRARAAKSEAEGAAGKVARLESELRHEKDDCDGGWGRLRGVFGYDDGEGVVGANAGTRSSPGPRFDFWP